jgi:hypothetical protein
MSIPQGEIKLFHHPQKEREYDLRNGQYMNTIHKDFNVNCPKKLGLHVGMQYK